MIDHNRLFKELITTFFIEFIELFFPQVLAYLEPSTVEFLNQEIFTDVIEGDEYETDIIAKVRFREREAFFLIHIENQSYKERIFERRMFRYFALLHGKYGLPVYPIAILSYDNPRIKQSNTYRVDFPDKTVLDFNFEVIQLNQLNWRDFLQKENPVASALMAKMKIAYKDHPKVKSECLRMLATLRLNRAKMKVISGFVDTYLKLSGEEEKIFQETIAQFEPAKKEAVMEIVTSWQLQGREEGRQEGKLELVKRQLNRKIGSMTPFVSERVSQLSTTQLEDLGEALLDFTSSGDLLAWLDGLES